MCLEEGSPFQTISFILGIIFFVLLLGIQPGALAEPEEECSVTVSPSKTLQETVDQVQTGSVICLENGRWEEHVEITKALTLRGLNEGAQIYAESKKPEKGSNEEMSFEELYAPVISIKGDSSQNLSVKLQNLRITSNNIDLVEAKNASMVVDNCNFAPEVQTHSSRLRFSNSSKNRSRQLQVSDSTFTNSGITIKGEAIKTSIVNTTIKGAKWYGIDVSSKTDSTEVLIKKSTLKKCGSGGATEAGIVASGHSKVKIEDTKILDNSMDGIFLYENASGNIKNSIIRGNKRTGISLWDTSQAVIFDTEITENLGSGVSFASWSRFPGEELKGNVLYQHSQYPSNIDAKIKGNTIVDNGGYGVVVYSSSCPFGYPSPWGMEYVGFWGEITGSLNKIQDNGERNPWAKTNVCPNKLAFLWAKGGRYPPKKG